MHGMKLHRAVPPLKHVSNHEQSENISLGYHLVHSFDDRFSDRYGTEYDGPVE